MIDIVRQEKQTKILFISHNAHRAGAQLFLLHLVQWILQHTNFEVQILIVGKGTLTNDFKQLAKTHVLRFFHRKSIKNRLLKKWVKFQIQSFAPKVIYSNTWMSGDALDWLHLDVKTIVHAHELNYWLDACSPSTHQANLKRANFFVTASDSVKLNLMQKFSISSQIIKSVYVPIHTKRVESLNNNNISEIIKLPHNAFVVAACGVESYRKGKDLFIPIAEKYLQKHPNPLVHFVWIGGKLEEATALAYEKSVYKSQIHFVPTIPNASTYFHAFHLFLMLSREDPFPTVNLEVGLHGVPIICFENAGGTQELIQSDAGIAVPMEDVDQVATAIAYLQQNEDKRQLMGQILKERVVKNYDITTIGNKIVEVILQQLRDE
ncbi:MAG: glycosyltransferase family 4 protein [Flavobacterium sp.]